MSHPSFDIILSFCRDDTRIFDDASDKKKCSWDLQNFFFCFFWVKSLFAASQAMAWMEQVDREDAPGSGHASLWDCYSPTKAGLCGNPCLPLQWSTTLQTTVVDSLSTLKSVRLLSESVPAAPGRVGLKIELVFCVTREKKRGKKKRTHTHSQSER